MALAIVGLICIGLVGLGTVLSLRPPTNPVEEVAVASPVALQPTFTPSPTITPIPPTPTNTPEPTPTPTLVVNPNAQEVADDARPTEVPLPSIFGDDEESTPVPEVEAAPVETSEAEAISGEAPAVQVSPTNTLVIQSPTPAGTLAAVAPPAQIPQGGGVLPEGNGFLVWAGVGLLLLLIFGLVNYLRSPQV
ncbi:MAG: hypothetical protein Fur0044_19640 [Anaerolineae bacterium]|nr:hypothetical protein [Anaerolineales bacterium]MCQ3979559.1 hypothetical protein [Anaerolineae bacterium]